MLQSDANGTAPFFQQQNASTIVLPFSHATPTTLLANQFLRAPVHRATCCLTMRTATATVELGTRKCHQVLSSCMPAGNLAKRKRKRTCPGEGRRAARKTPAVYGRVEGPTVYRLPRRLNVRVTEWHRGERKTKLMALKGSDIFQWQ